MNDIPFYTDGMKLIDHLRGHPLVTKTIVTITPPLYATENEPVARKRGTAKFFSPSLTWFMCELDPETGEAFGFVENLSEPAFSECG